MNQEIKKRELQNCDTVKAIMMLVVVICHCASACAGSGWFPASPVTNAAIFPFLAKFTNYYHVQTFFFASGYLFYFLRYELGKYKEPLAFVKNKAQRLLLPYIFAFIWVVPAYAIFFRPSVKELVEKFVLGAAPSQLWFLFALFWMYIAFYFLSLVLDRFDFFTKMNRTTAYILCFVFYLMSFGSIVFGKLGMINLFQILSAIRYFMFFFAGFVFRKFDFSRLYKYAVPLLIASVALSTAFYFNKIDIIEKLLWHPLCLFNVIAVFVFITKYVNPKGKLFGIFKKYNFQVYIIHQQVVYVIAFVLSCAGIFYPYPSFFICLAGALTVSLALSAVFAKFRVTRRLTGIK